ncbi:MAG: glutaredoxin family protein [Gammaproteobacteria bacterium]|jgi:glutaredoxin|nr:glutaredoxin family protein [Gammaproteobacteria bacterium]
MKPQLTVYIRHGCHLCEDLQQQLQVLQASHDFDFFTVDVDADPVITQQYAALVPVVVLGDRQICHYFLDQAALLKALADINPL